jgi:TLC ATP/ADP transporter
MKESVSMNFVGMLIVIGSAFLLSSIDAFTGRTAFQSALHCQQSSSALNYCALKNVAKKESFNPRTSNQQTNNFLSVRKTQSSTFVPTTVQLDEFSLQSTVASISDSHNDKSGWLSKILPPRNELRKLIPLALMFFCILFSYTILRDTKDVLMVTAPKSGAEVIPFVKTYCNLPIAIVRTQ